MSVPDFNESGNAPESRNQVRADFEAYIIRRARIIHSAPHRVGLKLFDDLQDLGSRIKTFLEANPIGGTYDRAIDEDDVNSEENGPCTTFLSMRKSIALHLEELDRMYTTLRPNYIKELRDILKPVEAVVVEESV